MKCSNPIFLLLLFLLLLSGRINLHAQISPQSRLLEDAYQTKSVTKLKTFFENWKKEIPTISDSELIKLDVSQIETYKVFKTFFRPENLKSFYYSPIRRSKTDFKGKYLVVQNSIRIMKTDKICINQSDSDSVIVNEIRKKGGEIKDFLGKDGHLTKEAIWQYKIAIFRGQVPNDSIIDFRPQIQYRDKIPVYLSRSYDTVFNNYFGNVDSLMHSMTLQEGPKFDSIQKIRRLFINKMIVSNCGLKCCYWILDDCPHINSITYDNTMNRALVDFEMYSNQYKTILVKEKGTWSVLNTFWTWVH